MKIRTGFVSNSSTSSFIYIGAQIKRTDMTDEQAEALDEAKLDWCSPGDDDDWIVGHEFASWSEEDGGLGTITVQELTEEIEEVQRGLNKVFGPDKYRPEICYGIRMS